MLHCGNIRSLEEQDSRGCKQNDTYIYIYIHVRGAKFSDSSCLWAIGNVENCVFAVVICTFLSIVICLDNLMFDGRTCFRPFELKYKMYKMFIFPVFLRFLFYHIHSHLKKGKRQSK